MKIIIIAIVAVVMFIGLTVGYKTVCIQKQIIANRNAEIQAIE